MTQHVHATRRLILLHGLLVALCLSTFHSFAAASQVSGQKISTNSPAVASAPSAVINDQADDLVQSLKGTIKRGRANGTFRESPVSQGSRPRPDAKFTANGGGNQVTFCTKPRYGMKSVGYSIARRDLPVTRT